MSRLRIALGVFLIGAYAAHAATDVSLSDSFMELPPDPLDIPYQIPFEDQFNEMIDQADAAIREGHWPEAVKLLENMILQNAGSLPVYVALVQVYRQLGQEEHARAIAEELTRQLNADGRGNDAGILQRSENEHRVMQLREVMAKGHRGQTVRIRKEFATLYQLKAMRTGDYEDLLRSAVLYASAGATNESERSFRQAMDLFPKEDQPYQGLAMMAAGRGNLDDAIAWLERARAIRPDNPDTLSNLGALYIRKGDIEKATLLLREALALDPNHRYALQSMTAILLKEGNRREALSLCETALKANPKSSVAHNRIAEIYLRDRKWDKVASHLVSALESYPAIEGANFYLGVYEESRGDAAKAREHYERELSFNPYYVPALNNLAWLLAKANDPALRDPPRAVELARRACEISRYQQLTIVDTLIHALMANSENNEANGLLDQAIALSRSINKTNQVARYELMQKELAGE